MKRLKRKTRNLRRRAIGWLVAGAMITGCGNVSVVALAAVAENEDFNNSTEVIEAQETEVAPRVPTDMAILLTDVAGRIQMQVSITQAQGSGRLLKNPAA